MGVEIIRNAHLCSHEAYYNICCERLRWATRRLYYPQGTVNKYKVQWQDKWKWVNRSRTHIEDKTLTLSQLKAFLAFPCRGVFSHSAGANYYVVYPGNTPENRPPTEACMINSKHHGVQNSGPWDPWQASDYKKKTLVYQQGL